MRTLAACALLIVGCKSVDPITDEPSAPPTPGAQAGTTGGFSASLSAELADVSGGDGAAADDAGEPTSAADSPAPSAAAASASPTPPSAAAASAQASGAAPAPPAPPARPARPAVEVSAELRAIQLELLPNWERDVEAAGTISRFITVHSRNEAAVFVFHYGYDEPDAPTERDEYKAYLAERKILRVTSERQRGGAWYLEGTDRTGKPAFRFRVRYGGKRLICHGSMYKQSALGDIRDGVVLEAQKICESLTL